MISLPRWVAAGCRDYRARTVLGTQKEPAGPACPVLLVEHTLFSALSWVFRLHGCPSEALAVSRLFLGL